MLRAHGGAGRVDAGCGSGRVGRRRAARPQKGVQPWNCPAGRVFDGSMGRLARWQVLHPLVAVRLRLRQGQGLDGSQVGRRPVLAAAHTINAQVTMVLAPEALARYAANDGGSPLCGRRSRGSKGSGWAGSRTGCREGMGEDSQGAAAGKWLDPATAAAAPGEGQWRRESGDSSDMPEPAQAAV